ncbi:MAG TPA: 5-methyltetrahydropteroyltriglutamate--homocysteine S-methyltransferase [Alphaproteobacteria bacterium]|jgi:5-methyltetrahydropteroyltriglutamate--homocysteine methyltransferase
MSARSKPPFRADHVGSLLRPKEILEGRDKVAKGTMTKAELRKIEDKHIKDAVAFQEGVGLRAVTDGEYRRYMWHLDFLEQIEGVELREGTTTMKFQGVEFRPPTPHVVKKVRHPKSIMGPDFAYLKSVAKVTPKVCYPSPSLLHFRGGRGAISKEAYPDLEPFWADLAKVYNDEMMSLAKLSCRYIQIDETDFAYLCDPKFRDMAKKLGEDPDKLPHTYAKLINASIKGRPADMAVCIHICRGNFAGTWLAQGGYEPVADALFNEIDVDGYFLEYDDARSGGFEPLRFVPKGKKVVVLGLITTKRPLLESKDELKARIKDASKYVPLEQLALSPQCGFASSTHGNPLTPDDQKRKLELVVSVAREVWGGV